MLIEHAAAGWEGLWSLLYAASHATLKLSLGVPLATGVDLTFAAMDIREARDELEWRDDGLIERGAAVDLGALRPTDDVDKARLVIDQLLKAALDRAGRLAVGAAEVEEFACLTRVSNKLFNARTAILGRIP
ncbi:hypothetical protein [Cellulomonas sp. Root137]|uniref:hypothetical protein n=1 Tax=Cellulomonas sp. Root137 TaxID=1736459 RepID=UPI0006F1E768|nr:hypothetical protein [Cellulomonas sp. Root137]KQY47980.1 hypothetical protein ASD18_12195 [Cellulomonas sp. Root137]